MKGECILYPCYFNGVLKRREGRRVPLPQASKNPTSADLEKAAKRCGVSCRIEQKHHPAHWFRKEGRVVAKYSGRKEDLVKRVAMKIEVKK